MCVRVRVSSNFKLARFPTRGRKSKTGSGQHSIMNYNDIRYAVFMNTWASSCHAVSPQSHY